MRLLQWLCLAALLCCQLCAFASLRDEPKVPKVGEGKKQVYGTQCKLENGEAIPEPIEDEANVDKRRAEVGLQPLAEYLKLLKEVYLGKQPEKKP
jgi:hypothetical protein